MSFYLPSVHYVKFSHPDLSMDPQTWANSIRDKVIATGRNKIAVFDNYPPELVDYYKALQEAIAAKIPDEQERPFICLNIKGASRLNDKGRVDIGMAGGTGPLSDATALVNMVSDMTKIEPGTFAKNREIIAKQMNNFSGVMYSIPPPRDFTHAIADFFNYRALYSQVRKDIPCSSLHILTNTGHSNKWVFDNTLFFGSKKYGAVYDMTEKVADKIQRESPEDKVLILGTVAADKAKLYPKLLEAREIEYTLPEGEVNNIPARDYLQKIIDQAKAGKITENMPGENRTCGDAFVQFCVDYANKTGSNSLLFSCTEIPMLLHTEILGERGTYLDKLNASLPQDKQFKLYDSEEIFVEEMAKQSQSLQDNPSLRIKLPLDAPELARDKEFAKLHALMEQRIDRFEGKADEKLIHKYNVLKASLNYMQNPTKETYGLLREAINNNPRFAEANMLWGSTTLALVCASMKLGQEIQMQQQSVTYSSKMREKIQAIQTQNVEFHEVTTSELIEKSMNPK